MNPIATATRAVLCGVLAVGVATASGCSSDHEASEARNIGTVTIPLVTTVGGSTYRLDAVFAISGAQGTVTLATNGNEAVLSTTLPTGSYDALLQSFSLSKDDGTGTFRDVVATVVSNDQPFTIFDGSTTAISFQFETDGVLVPLGSGNLNIGFGVTERPTPGGACDAITVDSEARTVESSRFFLDFSNGIAGDPEDVDVVRWKGGQNLTGTLALDTCTSGVVAYFGNGWAPPDPQSGGLVLVGSGSKGTWEAHGANILIHSRSTGCVPSTSIPVETSYGFGSGPSADTIEIQREFDFGSTPFNFPFRPFVPRLVADFDQVLHPNAAATTLRSENPFSCGLGCEVSDWNGSWFAYYSSRGPLSGQGMIVLRRPSAAAAHLWVDVDSSSPDTSANSTLLLPPPGGFSGKVRDEELFCFFDASSWTPAQQAALTLPPGCSFDLACNAVAADEEATLVSGGTFTEGPDQDDGRSFESTVSSFRLDVYEVTVARFRAFLSNYDAWRAQSQPAANAGANPNVPGSGWDSSWPLPSTATALKADLACTSVGGHTWAEAGNDALPIDCVSWYTAFAFCIWDGGRLPTEAEFEYAASDGSNNLLYPWGNTPVPTNLPDATADLANYNCLGNGSGAGSCEFADILEVGSKPAGAGHYGQQDLAGSMWEWELDWYGAYPASGQVDYAKLDTGSLRSVRGGSWTFDAKYLATPSRSNNVPSARFSDIGFRCARDP